MRDQSRIIIYDTTLRDGAQTEGITFSAEDKLEILRRLQSLGVDLIEGGWPGSNPTDDSFFESAGLEDAFAHMGTPLRITHENTVDSLNLTVAAGIGMHWFRQEVH